MGFTALAAAVCLFAVLSAAHAQITAAITSPPNNISVVAGQTIQLAASVRHPDATATQVQFTFNNHPLLQLPLNGPYVQDFVLPSNPGSYQLVLNVIDADGNLTTDARTVTVVAADNAKDPAPTTAVLTDLAGRTIQAGTLAVLTATAESQNNDGQRLGRVTFYADNAVVASYDGSGNPISAPAGIVNASVEAAKGNVYGGIWTVPDTDGFVNLITVATTRTGRSTVSSVVPVRVTTDTTNQPPSVAILGITTGEQRSIGHTINIGVTASDPDREVTPSQPNSQIAQVANYINDMRVGTPLSSPYGFPFSLRTVGTLVINSIATDGLGLSTVAVPVIFRVVGPTVVNLVKPSSTRLAEGSGSRSVAITRTGDLTQPLTVAYRTAGSAEAGVDYAPLSGSVTFPRGVSEVKIKVRALADGTRDADRTVSLILLGSSKGTYTLGKTRKLTLTIIDAK